MTPKRADDDYTRCTLIVQQWFHPRPRSLQQSGNSVSEFSGILKLVASRVETNEVGAVGKGVGAERRDEPSKTRLFSVQSIFEIDPTSNMKHSD